MLMILINERVALSIFFLSNKVYFWESLEFNFYYLFSRSNLN